MTESKKTKFSLSFAAFICFLVALALTVLLRVFKDESFLDWYNRYTDTLIYYEQWMQIYGATWISALLIVFNFVLDKKQKAKTLNVYHISFVTFITELFIVVLFGSLMKATAFGFDMFYVILITQGMLMFLNVPLNTYLVLLIMRVSTNFYKGDVYNE